MYLQIWWFGEFEFFLINWGMKCYSMSFLLWKQTPHPCSISAQPFALHRATGALSSDSSSRRVFMNCSRTPVLNTTHPNKHYTSPVPQGQTGAKAAFGLSQWQSSVCLPFCFLFIPPSQHTHTNQHIHAPQMQIAGIIHMSHVTRQFTLRSPQNGQSEPSPRPQ